MSLLNPLGIQTTAGRPAPPRRRSIAGELAEYGGKTLMGLGATAGTKLIEAGMGKGSALQDALVSDRVKAQQAEQQRLDKLTALSPAVVAQTQARARLGGEAMAQGGQTERREMQEAGLLERLKLELADKERQDAFMNDLRSQQQVLNEWKTKRKGRGSGKRGRAIKNADRFQKLAFRYGAMADTAEAEGKLGQAKEYRDLQAKNSELTLRFQAEAGLIQNEEGGFTVKPFPVEEPRKEVKRPTPGDIHKTQQTRVSQAKNHPDYMEAKGVYDELDTELAAQNRIVANAYGSYNQAAMNAAGEKVKELKGKMAVAKADMDKAYSAAYTRASHPTYAPMPPVRKVRGK